MAIEVIEHGLRAADPYPAVKRLIHRDGDALTVGDLSLNLREFERVFILGAGKASGGIARALEEILGDRLTEGLFVLRYGDEIELGRTRLIHAAHPVPDESSLRAGKELMRLASGFTPRDLVFAGITGGSSALLCLPQDGISLADKQRVNELLLLSGADIFQINAVRKHLSRIKGGWLAKAILPATLVNLTVSDVVGDALDFITGPTVPDTSTFADARSVMDEFALWERFPPAAARHLREGDETRETPKAFDGLPLFSFIVVPGDAACVAARKKAQALGFHAQILTTSLEGEARESGAFFSAVAREIALHGRPFSRPAALIGGGENVVSIGGDACGAGGPNQEFALSAALEIKGMQGVLIAAVDTDGADGPTEAAGALVDGSTAGSAAALPGDLQAAVRRHDSFGMLSALGEVVITGPTGTNVNDLKLALVR